MNGRGSGGLMVRAPAYRSRGRWFDSTSAVSKLGQFRLPHFSRAFRKRAVGPYVFPTLVPTYSSSKRAPAYRSRGRWFDSTSAVSKLGQFRLPHFSRAFRKRAVGPYVFFFQNIINVSMALLMYVPL